MTNRKSAVSKAARTTKNKNARTNPEVFVKKNQGQYPTGSWVVFTTPSGRDGKRVAPRVFSRTLTRDNVRNTYASLMGVSIQETRSRRVENY